MQAIDTDVKSDEAVDFTLLLELLPLLLIDLTFLQKPMVAQGSYPRAGYRNAAIDPMIEWVELTYDHACFCVDNNRSSVVV